MSPSGPVLPEMQAALLPEPCGPADIMGLKVSIMGKLLCGVGGKRLTGRPLGVLHQGHAIYSRELCINQQNKLPQGAK